MHFVEIYLHQVSLQSIKKKIEKMKKTNFGKNSRRAEAPLASLAPPSMPIQSVKSCL